MYDLHAIDAIALASIRTAVNSVENSAISVYLSRSIKGPDGRTTSDASQGEIQQQRRKTLNQIVRAFGELDAALRALIGVEDSGDCPDGTCRVNGFCVPCGDPAQSKALGYKDTSRFTFPPTRPGG